MVSLDSFMNLCRLCLKTDQAEISSFHSLESNNSELLDKIAVCLPVRISENDDLPKRICLSCSKTVDFIYNFWQLSSSSEKQLQEMQNDLKKSRSNSLLIENSNNVWQQENSLVLYDKDVILESKDLNDECNSNIEIKEVYFGDYVNQSDFVEEDIESVVVKEVVPDVILEDSTIIPSEQNAIIERNTSEDTQISQIVESSKVSLQTFEEDDPLKLKFWDVTLPDFFLIPYNYNEPEKNIESSTVVLMDLQNPQHTLSVENKSYACNVCQMTFTDQLTFLKHYENVHRLFKCPFCVKYFRRRYILENHLTVHSTRKDFSCPVCKMKFKRQSNVRHHVRRMHSFNKNVENFECAHCLYKTKQKRMIRIHVQSHLGIAELVCDVCGDIFNSNLDLNVHLNNHMGIKPYHCDICGNRFTRKHYMLAHRKLLHENVFSFQCHVCGRAFSFKNSLEVHMKLHTGENRIQCDVCNKVVSSKISLASHKKLHLNSKEFVCSICGKTYTNKYSLQEHLLVHTGSKPFQCLMCDKTFSTRKKLLHHEQIHDTDRSVYACSQCHKSYFSKFKLKDHFQKYHT